MQCVIKRILTAFNYPAKQWWVRESNKKQSVSTQKKRCYANIEGSGKELNWFFKEIEYFEVFTKKFFILLIGQVYHKIVDFY